MAWYKDGTASVTNGAAKVTGSGTDWVANVRIGSDGFRGPDGLLYEISTVVSATEITLATAYKGATASGAAYAIVPVQGYTKALADKVAKLINNLDSEVREATDQASAAADSAAAALASQNAAKTSQSAAKTSETNAASSASAAAASETKAASSASAAAASETKAASSATAAASSATSAASTLANTVRVDSSQSFTAAQKLQGQKNLGLIEAIDALITSYGGTVPSD